ncbi:MAG: response regulator, partial [Deltaproteobacteria bacterium]|nr:response regulator [Deltaproteobacteria bacterium]
MATRANILIVDDDKDQLDLFGLLLEKAKFKAFKALSVDEAMQILECEKVDCVVLDVFMPTTSGQVFTQYLRAHDALQDIPIIMLTAG